MKTLFNSLGSNYSFGFVLQALKQLLQPNSQAIETLKQQLSERFSGQVVLTYKGRDAIEYGLKLAGIGPGDQVVTQAFTCHAIEEAITRTKAVPVFADIDHQTFNPSLGSLEKALAQAPKAKAVIIQHTLGVPAEIKKIKAWCEKNKLLLIEDLASALGGVDGSGVPLGTYGDMVVLSFGRDKILDAVSGGALIVKLERLAKNIKKIATLPDNLPSVPQSQIVRDMLYPLVTWKIRTFQVLKIGSLIFWTSKIIGLLSSPVKSPLPNMAALPAQHAALALIQLSSLEADVFRRRKIAEVYQQKLSQEFHTLVDDQTLLRSSHVRFSLLVNNPDGLTKALKREKLYLTDRWYRSPVDSGRLNYFSTYQTGSCPFAEELAQKVVNLPTHRHVTIKDADRISQAVKNTYAQLHR